MELVLPFLVLFALLAIGVPVSFSLGLSGILGLTLSIGWDSTMSMVATVPYRTGTGFLLTTVPTFLLMAEFLAGGRIAKDLYSAMFAWLGRIRGGLAIATTVASGGMGAMTGSSTATAATFSAVGVPHMREYGYKDRLSVGSIAAAGTLASIIPPSVALIIYGITTETAIGDLFTAGALPGVLTVFAYVAVIYLRVRTNPELAPGRPDRMSITAKLRALSKVWPTVVLIALVLGGIYGGLVTPTEAGAFGAAGALVLSVLFGGLRAKGIWRALVRTAESTTMIISIVMFASIFGYFLTTTRVAPTIVSAIESSGFPTLIVMALIVLLYLVLGTFMDQIAILVVTLPITFPLITSLGYDPIWFGILVIKLGEIGLISPPVGLNVYVAAGAAPNVRLGEVFRGVTPFIVVELLLIVVMFLFPSLATWLPGVLATK
ncbi:MAG: TRAP transporter large permease subunit [Streptosporangiales bacterium]|nr:TRAP transporter large permease subunit [Streptosporangiales bacterium]